MADSAEHVLGESDWDEQDLLTIDEAGGRLEGEIAELDTQIAASSGDVAAALVARRAAMEAVRVTIVAGPTELAKTD